MGRDDTHGLSSVNRVRPVLACLVGLAIAAHAFTISFDALFAARNPALTVRVTGAAQADVRNWQVAALRDPETLGDPAIRSSAAAAIRREPLNASALRALAYHEEHEGELVRAGELAQLSQEVTRRDELNQLLLARLAAREDDVPGAMEHLGIALTTSRRTREEIFALMVPLLPDPEFRAALSGEVARDNEWIAAFARMALVSNGVDVRDVADVFLRADREESGALARAIGPVFLSLLARSGDAEATRALFVRAFPERVGVLRDTRLSDQTAQADMGWLGWSPVDGAATGAELGRTDDGGFGAIAFSSGAQDGAPVLRRVLQLSPGRYALTDQRGERVDGDAVRFDWAVKCHARGLWRPIDIERDGEAAALTIAPDCPMQMIELQAFARRGRNSGEVLIEDVRLQPVDARLAP